MNKNDVKTLADIATYTHERAGKSDRRGDPIAWAYWRETCRWAQQAETFTRPELDAFQQSLRTYYREAVLLSTRGDYWGASIAYSRAKWFAILLRNNKVRIPRQDGLNLIWMRNAQRSADVRGGRVWRGTS